MFDVVIHHRHTESWQFECINDYAKKIYFIIMRKHDIEMDFHIVIDKASIFRYKLAVLIKAIVLYL